MIDPEVRELAQGKNFAAFTSLLPGGAPMTHLMWVDCDENHILVNTEVHRGKYKNVVADPRVSVMIMDSNDDQHYADVTGRVVENHRARGSRAHREAGSSLYGPALHRQPDPERASHLADRAGPPAGTTRAVVSVQRRGRNNDRGLGRATWRVQFCTFSRSPASTGSATPVR